MLAFAILEWNKGHGNYKYGGKELLTTMTSVIQREMNDKASCSFEQFMQKKNLFQNRNDSLKGFGVTKHAYSRFVTWLD
jgi:hypothetical protein